MTLFNWVIRKENSSSSSKRNNDSTVSATSKKVKAETSWVQKPSFPATTEESCKELDKLDDQDAVEQPSNVVQVKNSPQL